MVRFILLTFAFLGWGFYELSGGSEFDPEAARMAYESSDPLKSVQTAATNTDDAQVTRVALNLTSVDDVPLRRTRPIDQLPQQAVVQNTTETPQQGESVTIVLPSLVANADPTPQPVQETVASAGFTDIRQVSGSRVNVRGGPGTGFGVVDQLVRGDEVEVLEDDGSGWVRLRAVNDGTEGWMADFLLNEG